MWGRKTATIRLFKEVSPDALVESWTLNGCSAGVDRDYFDARDVLSIGHVDEEKWAEKELQMTPRR